MKSEISKQIDLLLKSVKKMYITRAVEMKCVGCGREMEKEVSFFREGYHIQLCPQCRDLHIIYKKYED